MKGLLLLPYDGWVFRYIYQHKVILRDDSLFSVDAVGNKVVSLSVNCAINIDQGQLISTIFMESI